MHGHFLPPPARSSNSHLDSAELAERNREIEQTREEQAETTSNCDPTSETSSLWGRLFGDNSK
ncbi:hypothetical protein GCU68_17660 (plasmid) [Natronorubrum aibiense]|uniref:Uncharacterized protein n=1 Tax=Natronorubrum aibiense TaxID=348826 RepID=A0A5P9P893_9EURY|nr:hypothetical protein GCU68_17660 [Natronorubrum aibiense]